MTILFFAFGSQVPIVLAVHGAFRDPMRAGRIGREIAMNMGTKFFGLGFAGAVVLFGLAQPLSAGPSCLVLSLQEQKNRFTLSGGNARAEPGRTAKAIAADFRSVYEALEKNASLEGRTEGLIKTLSKEFLDPVAGAVKSAPCVVFHIRPQHTYFALDLLWLGTDPLFTVKPVGFAFRADADFSQNPVHAGAKGLILRDPSTDPENGAKDARNSFPSSKLFVMKETNMGILTGTYDFVLISGHGSVTVPWEETDDDDDDSIGFNKQELTAKEMGKVKYRLVYLDSCQLGISRPFIEAARRSGAGYFLAPIISNEAGNSSTKTIRYFFSALKGGELPLQALFTARQKLYQDFRKKPRNRLLYSAYPFRIYGL